MEQFEGRGCDVPVSPPAPNAPPKVPRAKRIFSAEAKAHAASLRKLSRDRRKEDSLALKSSGNFTAEMVEEEEKEKLKKSEENKRY
jgi:hypothetical protein